MATTRYVFTPFGAEFPATGFPQLLLSNRRPALAFDGTADEECQWTFVCPQGLSGALSAVITYAAATATSGAIGFQVSLEAISDGDALDTDAADGFDTANNSASTTVPATAGYIDQIAVTLTNADGIAAGDLCRLRLRRDADGTAITDTVTTDIYVLSVELREA